MPQILWFRVSPKNSESQLKERRWIHRYKKQSIILADLATDGEGEMLRILPLQLEGDGAFAPEKECRAVAVTSGMGGTDDVPS